MKKEEIEQELSESEEERKLIKTEMDAIKTWVMGVTVLMIITILVMATIKGSILGFIVWIVFSLAIMTYGVLFYKKGE